MLFQVVKVFAKFKMLVDGCKSIQVEELRKTPNASVSSSSSSSGLITVFDKWYILDMSGERRAFQIRNPLFLNI